MVWGVYGFTYTCANMIGTMCEVMETSPDIPRLIGTTVSGRILLSTRVTMAYPRKSSKSPVNE